jgi:hypothetical protein
MSSPARAAKHPANGMAPQLCGRATDAPARPARCGSRTGSRAARRITTGRAASRTLLGQAKRKSRSRRRTLPRRRGPYLQQAARRVEAEVLSEREQAPPRTKLRSAGRPVAAQSVPSLDTDTANGDNSVGHYGSRDRRSERRPRPCGRFSFVACDARSHALSERARLEAGSMT